MERLFQTHVIRRQEELNGIWEFQPVEEGKLPQVYLDRMAVPACWEMTISYCRYRGIAAYRKQIITVRKSNLRLMFKGVSHTGILYFDGKRIGEHYNAYTPFSFVVKDVEPGSHWVEMLVDNRWTEESKLHIPNDYYTYGGITRSVFWEEVADCYIERLEFVPWKKEGTCKGEGTWMAQIRIHVRNLARDKGKAVLRVSCGGWEARTKVDLPGGQETVVCLEGHFEGVREWMQDSPKLYLVTVILEKDGMEIDDLTDRVGFRTVSRENGRILVNGTPVFLKGVNRHEDHGIHGCAIPLSVMDADIKLLQELGANAVRTCHYPNDENFLDLCDENGILVWEESHDRGGDRERITNPLFVRQSLACMQEMLEAHCNHPSIILWACLNEAASHDEKGREIYARHMDLLATDKSRLTTFASNKYGDENEQRDICLDMAQVCSFNMYPYWYNEESVDDLMEKIRRLLADTGNMGKPLLISEYGGGGIYNFHDVMRVKWSEEFQADLIGKVTEELFAQPDVCGVFVWQFCDVRVSQEGARNWPMTRPGSRNNKGMVDEFRRPKMAFYALKEAFVHIKQDV